MIESVKNVVSAGRLKLIQPTVQEALDNGATPDEILDSMMAAMDEVGYKFQNNEIYVPEMLVAAKTMQRGVATIKPLLAGDAVGKYGKYVLGTVAGDLHDIGKNLVGIMIEAAGFEVIDLGIDIPGAYGTPIYASNGGTVIVATYHYSYGNYVVIDHGGGYSTLYGHNSSLCVRVGDRVEQGDVIAKMGSTGSSTGNHCHFEVRINGKTQQPLNYVRRP